MPSPLEFQINLSGNFASALERVGASARASGKELSATEKATKALEAEFDRVEGQLKALKLNPEKFRELAKAEKELAEAQKHLAGEDGAEFKFAGFMVDPAELLIHGLEMAVELAEKLVETVVDVGKEMVHVAADTQDLNLAIKLDVGEEGSKKVEELGEEFRQYSRFSAAKIKNALLPLLEQGSIKDDKQLEDLTTAATDVAARRKQGIEGVQGALASFQQIALRRDVNPRILKELAINAQDYFKDLGDLYHITAKQAEKRAKEGKFASETLLSVALNQIQSREGGKLGNATDAASKTLGATLERLGDLKENLFEKIADSPGIQSVQRFLETFEEVMGGPTGTELVEHLSSILETVFGGPDADVQGIRDTLTDAVRLVTEMVDGGKELADALLPSLETVQDMVIGMREFIAAQSGDTAGLQAAVQEEIEVRAQRMVRGFQRVNRMEAKFQSENANAGMYESSAANEAGMSLADVPKFAAGGVVDGPTLAIIGEEGPEAVVPLRRAFNETAFGSAGPGSGAFGGGSQITFSPVFQFGDNVSADARDVVRQAGQAWRDELARFVHEMAGRTGTAA